LTPTTYGHIDAAAQGAFFSLTVDEAKSLIEMMIFNQGWSDERLQPRQRGTHIVKEADMLTAKMDLLMKRLMDPHMTCEFCGNIGHSGNHCPETQEDVMYMNDNNNGYPPRGGQTRNQQ
jgi:hypothetical protein